jgi:hypothetical protein
MPGDDGVTRMFFDTGLTAHFDETLTLLTGFTWLLGLLAFAAVTFVRVRPPMLGSA